MSWIETAVATTIAIAVPRMPRVDTLRTSVSKLSVVRKPETVMLKTTTRRAVTPTRSAPA
jgi:hypothetical protein